MKELEALIVTLEDHSRWKVSAEEHDFNVLIKALYECDINNVPFVVPQGAPVIPPMTLVLAKLLQRIDKLEDKVYELSGRIDKL